LYHDNDNTDDVRTINETRGKLAKAVRNAQRQPDTTAQNYELVRSKYRDFMEKEWTKHHAHSEALDRQINAMFDSLLPAPEGARALTSAEQDTPVLPNGICFSPAAAPRFSAS